LLFLGALYLAVGLVFSTMSDSQVVAFLGTLFFFLLLRLATVALPPVLGDPWASYLYPLSVDIRISDFARGVIDTAHLVFFIAAAAWFLVVAGVLLMMRRWR
jgi:ABC-2 type transport system permease protein